MTDVPAGSVLHTYATPGYVAIIGVDNQETATLALDSVRVLQENERQVFRTQGQPAWFKPEDVRTELMRIRGRIADDRALVAIAKALELVEHASQTATGVGVVPPPGTA